MTNDGTAYRSKLEPHFETIKKLRQARKKWSEIALYLEEKKGVKAAISTIHDFFKNRTMKKKLPLGFAEKYVPFNENEEEETQKNNLIKEKVEDKEEIFDFDEKKPLKLPKKP